MTDHPAPNPGTPRPPQFGPCPHCDSPEIVRVANSSSPDRPGESIRVGFLRTVELTGLVCLHCGFFRQFVATQDGLDQLRRKYGPQLQGGSPDGQTPPPPPRRA